MVGKCGLSCPIYATIPVYKMGQMFMYDLYQVSTAGMTFFFQILFYNGTCLSVYLYLNFQSWHNNSDFTLFTLDDVDAAFDKIVQLKYNQSVSMKGWYLIDCTATIYILLLDLIILNYFIF